MNTPSFTQSESTRLELIDFIQNSIDLDLWKQNSTAIDIFKNRTKSHRLFEHPILNNLHEHQFSLDQLKFIHINYFTAIVKNFTDALSMTIYQAVCLENNHLIDQKKRISSKVYARYLLSLNLIDELGFNTHNLEQSSASKSHLIYFIKLLDQLQIDNSEHQNATQYEAYALSEFIQNHMNSYAELLLILACTELQVIKFSEALRDNISIYGNQYTEGYYACHGIAHEDSTSLANDDNHEDDIWILFTQCYTPETDQHFKNIHNEYLTLWENFWNKMYQTLR